MYIFERSNNCDNLFDFLRFLAAVMVIFSHSYALLKLNQPFHFSTGEIAVFMFFIISGFLIAKSWDEQPDVKTFLRKRIL